MHIALLFFSIVLSILSLSSNLVFQVVYLKIKEHGAENEWLRESKNLSSVCWEIQIVEGLEQSYKTREEQIKELTGLSEQKQYGVFLIFYKQATGREWSIYKTSKILFLKSISHIVQIK